MDSINQAITAVIILIETGGLLRIFMIILDIIQEPDSKDQNIKRIRHVIVFMILTVLIYSLKNTVLKYYQ